METRPVGQCRGRLAPRGTQWEAAGGIRSATQAAVAGWQCLEAIGAMDKPKAHGIHSATEATVAGRKCHGAMGATDEPAGHGIHLEIQETLPLALMVPAARWKISEALASETQGSPI